MHLAEIIRVSSSVITGTRGVLLVDRQPFLVTLELPWRMNEPFNSCIPIGEYTCERYTSSRYEETFIVLGVPDRDGILWHPGNFLRDTDGCILPGLYFGNPCDPILISNSKEAFEKFMEHFYGLDEFSLVIRNAF